MSKKTLSNDTIKDRSDVKSLLETIETMYTTCQNVLNTYTQTTLMLAITVEAQMLLMKLCVMKERWAYHLPFKEACTVDFYDWGKKIEKMSLSLVSPEENGGDEPLSEYCPSKHFLLDLYTELSDESDAGESLAYYRELDIPKFISNQEKVLRLITRKWLVYKYKFSDMVAQKVNSRTGNVLQPLADRTVNIQMTCCEVLQQLSATLYELYDMPKGVIQRDQFARFAERVVNEAGYGGRKAQQSARRDVDNLKNTTPEDEWDERCDNEIKASIEFINELKYGRQVFTFLGRSYDIQGRYAGLGKFLNSIRKDISADELYLLIEQLYRIHYFLEEKSLTETSESDAIPAAEAPAPSSVADDQSADIVLPTFFNHDLRVHAEATRLMIVTLRRVSKYMGRNLTKQEKELPEARPYVKWKWNHLHQAFKDFGIIDDDTSQSDFAGFLVRVLPNRKLANILQSFYRNCDKMSASILADVKDEFMPVKVKMKQG